MIYDYFRVTGAHDTVLDDADLFSVTLHNKKCSGIQFYYLCQRFHLMMLGKLVQNEDTRV